MTLRELMASAPLTHGHTFLRVRDPRWTNPDAYMRVSVLAHTGENGAEARALGPWLHLFDRSTQELIGEPTPQVASTIIGGPRLELDAEVDRYEGPLDPADV